MQMKGGKLASVFEVQCKINADSYLTSFDMTNLLLKIGGRWERCAERTFPNALPQS